jgi:hypothetical protein
VSEPFHRTPRGLSNQATFAGVEVIVFAEGGGASFSLNEIEEGAGDSSTLDGFFWSTVIRSARPNLTVEVRSVGNKRTVQAVAALIETGSVTRVFAALDRDFDDRRGNKLSHPNIFYTRGYSWENDVFRRDILIEVLGSVSPNHALASVANHMREAEIYLKKNFSNLVRFDHALASAGKEITLREVLFNSIQLHERKSPIINRSALASEIKRCRSAGSQCCLGPRACACVEDDLHGHTVARWWFGHVNHALRTYIGVKMSREVIARLSISTFARTDSTQLEHYRHTVISATL